MARTEDQRFTVSESMTIGFIGAGRMAQAMSRGFISKGEDIFILGQPELSAVKGNHSNINFRQTCIIIRICTQFENLTKQLIF